MRKYLCGIRDMTAEAAASLDPRVIVTALRILELAPATIRRMRRTRILAPAA